MKTQYIFKFILVFEMIIPWTNKLHIIWEAALYSSQMPYILAI